jgi:hypothetical protein
MEKCFAVLFLFPSGGVKKAEGTLVGEAVGGLGSQKWAIRNTSLLNKYTHNIHLCHYGCAQCAAQAVFLAPLPLAISKSQETMVS